jgi:DNA-binding NtrC family response regulator
MDSTSRQLSRQITILVVEDDVTLCWLTAELLNAAGFLVIQAHNADDAVRILERPGCAVDVVFSDVEMPGKLNGFGLASWVGRERPGVIMILTSGRASSVMPDDVFAHGPLMPKPYDVNDLAKRIRQMAAE